MLNQLLYQHAQLLGGGVGMGAKTCQNKINLKLFNEVSHEAHIDTLSDIV